MSNSIVAINIVRKNNKKRIAASLFQRENRDFSGVDTCFTITLFEFDENEQFSNLDAFLVQIGLCTIYLSEDFEDRSKGDGKKIFNNVLVGKDYEVVFVKNIFFQGQPVNLAAKVLRLTGKATHSTNVAEMEMPLAYRTLECLMRALQLTDDEECVGCCALHLGALGTCMRLDSAAAEAVNLLPRPDHPSQFGSLFGVLNRCKTKMGPRVLERWLRQPLVSTDQIHKRQDVVEVLLRCVVARNKLIEGPLKSVPDVDTVIRKMQKRNAGLDEVFRLYILSRSLPAIRALLMDMLQGFEHGAELVEGETVEERFKKSHTLRHWFLEALDRMSDKFSLYQRFVEQLLDMSKLPALEIDAAHDSALKELREERDQLQFDAQSLLREAQSGWASFATVSLETDPRNKNHGMVFRTTRGDDERQLRANKKDVKIVSILKNGVHFTTPQLERLSEQYHSVDEEYRMKQQSVVAAAMETALTYLPLAEAASELVAELDVLLGFATAASVAPREYVRPSMHESDFGAIRLEGARHPCVELMDDVQFVANDYFLERGQSNFQIITGPNMGGKSTYIRAIGSIVVMAQVGSFVPCSSAQISVVDSILARVGAGDAVQKGVSTFMAEMLEASVIISTATKDSLIIIDELGRGTSTFDGFGLAWGISEHIASQIGSYTLFATHFHELTALAETTIGTDDDMKNANGAEIVKQSKGVVNKHVSGRVVDGEVVMLYSVKDGPCNESFGVHVAAMAQFPRRVIDQAKRKAQALESYAHTNSVDETTVSKQARVLNVMTEFAHSGLDKLKSGDVKNNLKSLVST